MTARPPQSAQKAPRPSSPPKPPDPIPRLLPGGGVNLLIGAANVGKSALLAGIAVCFRDQQPIFGHQPSPLPKLAVLGADRSWESTQEWFARAGWPDVPAHAPFDADDFNEHRLTNKRARIDILQEAINVLELPWGSLLIVDPIILFLGGNILDYDACASACIGIRRVCRRRGITILGTVHASKQKTDPKQRYARLQDRIAGSTALTGFTDTQLYLAGSEELDQPYHLLQWCPHLAPMEEFRLQKNALGLLVPYLEVDDDGTNPATAVRVLGLVPETPVLVRSHELVEQASELGISRATLFRQLTELHRQARILKIGRGAYCRPRPH